MGAVRPDAPQPGEGLTGAGLGALNRGVGAAAIPSSPAASRPLHSNPQVAPRAQAHGSSDVALLVGIAVGAALVLVLAVVALWLRGHRRLRESLSGDAEGAIAELRGALVRLRVPTAPGATLDDLARRLQADGAPDAARYARLLCLTRYARPRPGGESPSLRDRGASRRALAALARPAGGPRWRAPVGRSGARLRALLALPPGLARPAWWA